MLNIAEMFRN